MIEFDDAVYNGVFRTSKKARDAIASLMVDHDLHFIQNPGGGEFFNDHIRVQVTLCDDVDDYQTLAKRLKVTADEPKPIKSRCPFCDDTSHEFVYKNEKQQSIVRCMGCHKLFTIFVAEAEPHHNAD